MFNTRRWNFIDDIFVRFLVFPVSGWSSASVKQLPHTPDEVLVSAASDSSDSYNQKESVRARDIVQPVGKELSCHLPQRLMKRSQVRGSYTLPWPRQNRIKPSRDHDF